MRCYLMNKMASWWLNATQRPASKELHQGNCPLSHQAGSQRPLPAVTHVCCRAANFDWLHLHRLTGTTVTWQPRLFRLVGLKHPSLDETTSRRRFFAIRSLTTSTTVSRTSERADRRAPPSLVSTIKKKQSSFTREFAFTYKIKNDTKITPAIWSFNSTTSGKVAGVFSLCVCESWRYFFFHHSSICLNLLSSQQFCSPTCHLSDLWVLLPPHRALSAQSCPSVCVFACMIVWVIFWKHVWVWPIHAPRELLLQKVRNWNHLKLVNSAVNVTADNLCCHGYVLLILLK